MSNQNTSDTNAKRTVSGEVQVVDRRLQDRLKRIRTALLQWYLAGHRDLPWRRPDPRTGRPAPYRVLVSEVMLQQTQVATVRDYYRRFLARFPTVRSLAKSDEQDVLRLWQGLGYYRRARLLHAAARQIVDTHGRRIPNKLESLMSLPGVGRSTAGAVASIAFGQPSPILDGNVKRVLARIQNIDRPTAQPDVQALLWRLSEQIVHGKHPGDVNQALMELGAVVCTPRNPMCSQCPVHRSCLAYRNDSADRIPVPNPRRQPTLVTHHVLAISHNGRYLFQRRPVKGLWSNMWQMPTAETLSDAAPEAIQSWANDQFGPRVSQPCQLDTFIHMTTHRRIEFSVWTSNAVGGKVKRGVAIWRRLNQLDDLPLSNPQRRVVSLVS